ncbi:hypothetical protein J7E97_01160 [Streptomyces sp. ISL-66]|uniref:hypothetical protein n=1 Tax=Streptomyces sp. ISL-66 TaxID=2819186 RepID=UPI001BEA496B|nr:hypothetical protein [Streptomyces sp. ISL-66]MBT2466505.1 hypothetical protein [Streptomyces sp. ISL-66]
MKQAPRRLGSDIGLSGLMNTFHYPRTNRMSIALAHVGWFTERGEGAYAHQLLEDTQRLLASPLSGPELAGLWQAGTSRDFDLEACGIEGRQWLMWIEEIAEYRVTFNVGDAPVPPYPPPALGLTEAVLGEIASVARDLESATAGHSYAAVPGVVPVLRRVAAEVDPDLGFRLLLRMLKSYLVPIGPTRVAGYHALAEPLGLEKALVEDGDFIVWPDLG